MTQITPTNESPDEVSVPVEKKYNCEYCQDSKVLHFDESDGEGNYANTGIKDCDMCADEPDTDY